MHPKEVLQGYVLQRGVVSIAIATQANFEQNNHILIHAKVATMCIPSFLLLAVLVVQ
ncbi:36561_t:CDS:2, partial [Racocetra persica]